MINKNTAKKLLIVLIILLIFAIQEPSLKQAVADVEGQACTVDIDCPCWGQYMEGEIVAYGLGSSLCTEGTCDTTFCLDIQPIGQWFVDHPWQGLKNNPMILIIIIALTTLVIKWPKV